MSSNIESSYIQGLSGSHQPVGPATENSAVHTTAKKTVKAASSFRENAAKIFECLSEYSDAMSTKFRAFCGRITVRFAKKPESPEQRQWKNQNLALEGSSLGSTPIKYKPRGTWEKIMTWWRNI